jgi:hypothetical protein
MHENEMITVELGADDVYYRVGENEAGYESRMKRARERRASEMSEEEKSQVDKLMADLDTAAF